MKNLMIALIFSVTSLVAQAGQFNQTKRVETDPLAQLATILGEKGETDPTRATTGEVLDVVADDIMGAATGAAAGSVFGPIGAAIGAVLVGAAASYKSATEAPGQGGNGVIKNAGNSLDYVGQAHNDTIHTINAALGAGSNDRDAIFGIIDGCIPDWPWPWPYPGPWWPYPPTFPEWPEFPFDFFPTMRVAFDDVLDVTDNPALDTQTKLDTLEAAGYMTTQVHDVLALYFNSVNEGMTLQEHAQVAIDFETMIINSPNLTEEERAALMSAMSTARHSMALWSN